MKPASIGRAFLGRSASVALVAAAALTLACPARASGDDRAAAEALFNKGREAAKRGDLDAACAAFEESTRLDPAPGTMFNLGDCEEKRHHDAVAWQWFQETLTKLSNSDKRRSVVRSRISALEARLPTLTIRLAPGSPADTVVARDGSELHEASLGVALPIDAGTHRVVVSASGHQSRTEDVELAQGDHKELVVAPGPETAPAPAPVPTPAIAPPPAAPVTPPQPTPAPASASHPDTRMLGYVIGGAGAASVITALILGGVALGEKSTVEDHCDKSTRLCDSQSAVDAASTGSTLATASTVTFIVGAAALGVGTYFILTSGKAGETSVKASAGLDHARLSLIRTF
ncbi:MAG TPA: tetratricopeptide repeat protein [Polyangiaceae bacterium]|nr:tetratricopeptide repeat protein [Polyangiaceae bacterium]